MNSSTRGRTVTRASGATRRTVLGALCTAGTGVLAACGAGGAPAGGAAPGGQIKESVTLEFQHRWEGVREPLMQQVVTEFAAVQPNVKINNLMVFCSDQSCFQGMPLTKIITQISAGQPPDVVMLKSDSAADWHHRGALGSLDAYLKRDKLVPEQVFYPALAKMGQRDGQTHGLPQLTGDDQPYLYMNSVAFEQSGLDPKRPPRHWDDLIDHALKLTQRQGDSFGRVGLALPGMIWEMYYSLNAGKMLSADGTKATFDTQEGIEALQWMVDATNRVYGSKAALDTYLRSVQAPTAPGAQAGAARVPWYQGKVGMWINGVHHFYEIKTEAQQHAPGFRYEVSTVVPNNKNPRARQQWVSPAVWLYVTPKGIKRPDAAWEWLKYITAGDGNKTFTLAQERPSPAVKVNEDPAFARANPHWETVKKALTSTDPLPQTPAWPRISPLLTAMTNRVLAGEQGVRDALASTGQEAQRLLDEVRR